MPTINRTAVVLVTIRTATVARDMDLAPQRLCLFPLGELAVEGLHHGAEGEEALERAGEQQGHDDDDQGHSEHQLVADPPVAGHAPTSLPAPRLPRGALAR